MFPPTSGEILWDNKNIADLSLKGHREKVALVPQEVILFGGSIKDNITIGEQYATDEQILKAAQIAGVHDFLGKHEKGYDLIVGERGEGLSGGERQAVTLARAILSNPNILVFDEPTNMMDELSENLFKKKVQSIIKDKTVIIITHKPSLLSIVDRLIVVEDGKIVADGPKEKIIAAFGAKVKPTTVVNTVVKKRVIDEQ